MQSESTVGAEGAQWMQRGCTVNAERVQSGGAQWMQSGCTVDAEWVHSGFRVGAERVQSGRHAITTVRGDSRTLRASS